MSLINMNQSKNEDVVKDRDKIIIRTSRIGIAANILLALIKINVGFISNSIAVVLDAVNNLSDALSSIITIIGAKFARRLPDKKHPLGHGRAEYLSALVVAAIVLYVGLNSLEESIKKILNPEMPDYSTTSLVIIFIAIFVKVFLGRYFKSQGKRVNSQALQDSGAEASFDAIVSASVLASALIYTLTGISLEAYVGAVISCFITKSGVEMLIETLDDIIGKRTDPELAKKIRGIMMAEPKVHGAYNLFVNNYGPDKNYASVILELPDTMTVDEADVLTKSIERKIYRETRVILAAVGVSSYNTHDSAAGHIRHEIRKLVMSHEWVLQIHGFHADVNNKEMRFNVVMSFNIDPKEGLKTIYQEVHEKYPDYKLMLSAGVDISD